jgi:hypothetical protein
VGIARRVAGTLFQPVVMMQGTANRE